MSDETKKSIREQILGAIDQGSVRMRPRWHFVLKTILAVIGGVILVLTLLYLVSFILFVLRRSGAFFAPSFGWHGWYAFLLSLPWLLIILVMFFLFILEVLVRRYAFAYRRPLLYSVATVVFFVFAGGYIVAVTSFQPRMSAFIEKRKMPIAGPMYREYGRPRSRNIHSGQIAESNREGFFLRNRREEMLTIIVTRRTRLPRGADFSAGDMVVVFGPREGDRVEAYGVQKMDREE